VSALVVLTLLVCVVAVAGREPLRGSESHRAEPPSRSEHVVVAPPPGRFPVPGALPPEVFVVGREAGPLVPGWLAWAVAGIGLAGAVAAGVLLARNLPALLGRSRRRTIAPAPAPTETRQSSPEREDHAEIARRALVAASAPLHDPADPRTAVVEAYERLERGLAEHRLGRRSPEAPREYLARVLSERRMPAQPFATLTTLFEEARFGQHAIPESAPRRALAALQQALAAIGRADP